MARNLVKEAKDREEQDIKEAVETENNKIEKQEKDKEVIVVSIEQVILEQLNNIQVKLNEIDKKMDESFKQVGVNI